MAPGLVDNETVEELGIFEAATDLADEFDTLEVDVLALEIGNAEDGLDGHAGELVPEARNDLGVQGGLANLVKKGVVGWGEVKGLTDLFEALHGDVAGAVEAFGDAEWVEAAVEKAEGGFEEAAGEDNDGGCAITDFIVHGLGEIDKKLGDLMLNVHLLHDCSTIVGDGDLVVWGNNDLIETAGAKGCLEDGCRGRGSLDVSTEGFDTAETLLGALITNDNEWVAALVESERHTKWSDKPSRINKRPCLSSGQH